MFPCQFVQRLSFCIFFVQTTSVATVFFIPIYFVPLLFQFTRNDSAIDAGVRLLPLVLNGGPNVKVRIYMPWYLVGGNLSLVGTVLQNQVVESTTMPTERGHHYLLTKNYRLLPYMDLRQFLFIRQTVLNAFPDFDD
ncbi:hypothetical protein BDW69DRAFT_189433 [Aspergillus filifer]